MASAFKRNSDEVEDVTICSLCRKNFSDPIIIPCIHTFCRNCLQEQGSRSNLGPEDKIPCPVCRKEFAIPRKGFSELTKDFFIERLVRMKTIGESKSEPVQCTLCLRDAGSTQVSSASNYCIECQDNLCETCALHHKKQRLSRDHQLIDNTRLSYSNLMSLSPPPRNCELHPTKPVDLYCTNCRLTVCLTCFVEMHQGHKCSDVQKLEDFYRNKLAANASKAAWFKDMVCAMREELEDRERSFENDFKEKERLILDRSQELKVLIDQHTKSLLGTLSTAKRKQSEAMEKEREQLERLSDVVATFKTYCSELASKGSAEEICRLEDVVGKRSDDLQNDIRIPRMTLKVCLNLTNEWNAVKLNNYNIVGIIAVEQVEAIVQLKSNLIVVGIETCPAITKEVIRINLEQPADVSQLREIPTKLQIEAAGIAHNGMLFVTGIGENSKEIWKYNCVSTTWRISGSLVRGRRRHCLAFVDHTLYICGGSAEPGDGILNSIEAHDTSSKVPSSCTAVGQLTLAVECSASVAFGSSIYIFGGSDKDLNDTDFVQVFNTCLQTCAVLNTRMPVQLSHVRAVRWDMYAIVMNESTCLLFNFITGTWLTRARFKTDVSNFGLTLVDERIFVVGGETWITDRNARWSRTDVVRYVPVANIIADKAIEWKIHAKLPRPGAVQTCVQVLFL